MGFTPKRTILKLQFEDPAYAGLEIKIRALGLGVGLEIADEGQRLREGGAAALPGVRKLISTFVGQVAEWNIEGEDGAPIPITEEGFAALELDFAVDILMAWYEYQIGISANLGKASTSGAPSVEASMPMESLSESPANSPTLN